MKQYFQAINGLRAIAALGIAAMHYRALGALRPTSEFINTYVPFGTFFVFLFFMVSAFGMCCGYYEKIKTQSVNFNTFYKSRYKKILPYFALLVFIDVLAFMGGNHSIISLKSEIYEAFADLTLCFNLLPNPYLEVMYGGWFIGVIFLFYIMFPFIVFLLDNKKRAWIVLFITIILHLMVRDYFLTEKFVLPMEMGVGRHNIVFSFCFLVAGGIVYLYKNQIQYFFKNKTSVCVLLVILLVTTSLSIYKCETIDVLLLIPLFSLWIMYAMTKGVSIMGHRFLNNRVMKFLGGISMEIYLTHMMILRGLEYLHLERYITDGNIFYIVTYCIGMVLTILFAFVVKTYIFPALGIMFYKIINKN